MRLERLGQHATADDEKSAEQAPGRRRGMQDEGVERHGPEQPGELPRRQARRFAPVQGRRDARQCGGLDDGHHHDQPGGHRADGVPVGSNRHGQQDDPDQGDLHDRIERGGDLTEAPDDDLVDGVGERARESRCDPGQAGLPARLHDQQHADEADQGSEPTAERDPLAQEKPAEQGEQERRGEAEGGRGGDGQESVGQHRERVRGDERGRRRPLLPGPIGPQQAPPRHPVPPPGGCGQTDQKDHDAAEEGDLQGGQAVIRDQALGKRVAQDVEEPREDREPDGGRNHRGLMGFFSRLQRFQATLSTLSGSARCCAVTAAS
jgi:hypothetical protein